MATVATKASSPIVQPQRASEPAERRILLRNVRWKTYEMLAQDLDGSSLYMTYDRGDLELMVVSQEHERYKILLRYIMQVLAEELGVDYLDGGSSTMKRKDVAGAIESDNWFYFGHCRQVLGKKEIDLRVDPPPDLGLEVDVSRSSLNRLKVYAALRIPEVWRFDGSALIVYRLRENAQYEVVAASMIYPTVPLVHFPELVREGLKMSYLQFVRHVRDWVRREVLSRSKPPRPTKRRRPRR